VFLALGVVLSLVVVGGIYSLIEPRLITVADYEITNPQLPPAFDGLEIVFLADVHLGPYFSQERVRDLVARVNTLEPDLIILGGDYVYRDAPFVEPCFAELAGLRAPLGVYGVLGNHDHYAGAGLSRRAMTAAGIVELDNRGVWIERDGGRMRLGGVDDVLEGYPDVGPTLAGARPEDFLMLVSHNPDYLLEMPSGLSEGMVDLMLAGHTHGGQITLFGLWAPVVSSELGQSYRTGLAESGPFPVLVSNGIGTIIVPMRFFAPPQIVVVRLSRGV
jgi:predicted MPP superfamily phosphohydrolase